MISTRSYSIRGRPLIAGHAAPIPTESFCATVLSADLHGYEALLEFLPSSELVALLGELDDRLAGTVLEYGGQIFGVPEAGLLAGFGIGDTRSARTFEALSAARLMQARFAPLRAHWQEQHAIDTALGIGLHRGEVAIGRFGPAAHASLVGEAANGAAQLARRARAGEILLSAAACAQGVNRAGVTGLVPVLMHLPPVMIRGRRAPLDVWCAPLPERLTMRPPWGARPARAAGH